MWAMGVLLYYMLVGFLPFRGRTVGQLRKAILEGSRQGEIPVPPRISEPAAALIRRLLNRNPKNRPKAANLIEEAQSPTSTHTPRRPFSVDRLAAAAGTNIHRKKNQKWLAQQVFPTAYPINKTIPGVSGIIVGITCVWIAV